MRLLADRDATVSSQAELIVQQAGLIETLTGRVAELERQAGKDSRRSSKPPSSEPPSSDDPYTKAPKRSSRKRAGRGRGNSAASPAAPGRWSTTRTRPRVDGPLYMCACTPAPIGRFCAVAVLAVCIC